MIYPAATGQCGPRDAIPEHPALGIRPFMECLDSGSPSSNLCISTGAISSGLCVFHSSVGSILLPSFVDLGPKCKWRVGNQSKFIFSSLYICVNLFSFRLKDLSQVFVRKVK